MRGRAVGAGIAGGRALSARIVGGRAVVAGIAVALLAGVALSITHRTTPLVVARPVAVRAALHDAQTERVLAGSGWNAIAVNSLDDQLEHVTFFRSGRLIDSVTVDRTLQVQPGVNGRTNAVPYGDWIAYQPAVLAALCLVFVLMAGVWPWRRRRNLDVAACLSFVAPVVLLRHEYIDASVLSALPGLGYLLARCLRTAFGPPARPAPATALLDAITPGLEPARRVRWLRGLLIVSALVFAMVAVGSPSAVDVVYAVMEGATRLSHGVLPYGHMPPGIVHGDTYPILSYALYVPLALLSPVRSTWDSVLLGLAAASLAAFLAAWALYRGSAAARARRGGSHGAHPKRSGSAGAPPDRGRARSAESEEAGLRAALAWLAFPPLLITASTGTTDIALAAMLAGALLLWRRPAACSALLTAAGWFKLAPFALLPVCLAPLRGRRLARALVAAAAVSAAPLALLLALGGPQGPAHMLHAMSYQVSRGSLQSLWSALGLGAIQPVAQAGVLGLIAAAAVRLREQPELAQDRVRMAALAAAILLGLQLAADYWAFLYLVWFIPLVGLSLLAEPVAGAERVAAPAPLSGSLQPAPALAA